METLVQANEVGKKFCRDLKKSVLYGIQDISRDLLGLQSKHERLRREEFWSLRDISVSIRRGECLAVIGPNGAGKSTLLKILSGIILPDRGRVSMCGRVGSLIEIGAGFHPMLSGRENIYISGLVLGMSHQEIEARFDEIVDFSGLEEFLDTPVKFYSSGMYVRLGFSIAVHLEPDIMLIDEVLAVGDIGFRHKCYTKIEEIKRNAAVVFVSHFPTHVSRLCDHALLLNEGHASMYSEDVATVLDQYTKISTAVVPHHLVRDGVSSRVISINEQSIDMFELTDDEKELRIRWELDVPEDVPELEFNAAILDSALAKVAVCNSVNDNIVVRNTGRTILLEIAFDISCLGSGTYYLSLLAFRHRTYDQLAWHHGIAEFRIQSGYHTGYPVVLPGNWKLDSERLA
ncbi:MAG: polysaccharide ABC transporter ATP-binding protein [Thiotrichales bacterium]|nr:polysaccharide ABC transporter ATP-binding protein [Thiotrichales bacterium]